MSRELKVLQVETSGAARELLDAMHALTSSEGWALFEQLVETAYADAAFVGQATAILSTGDAIERRMAELVGQRKAAHYIMGLPRVLKHQCQAMLSEEPDGMATQG